MYFLKRLKKYGISLFAVVATFFLLGYFLTDFVFNATQARYVYVFSSEEDYSNYLLQSEFYDTVFQKIDEHNKQHPEDTISYAKIDYQALVSKATLEKKNGVYEFSFLKKYFPNMIKKNGTINQSDNRVVNYFNLIFKQGGLEASFISVRIDHYQNPYWIGGICSGAVLFIFLVLLCLFPSHTLKAEIEDNQTIFHSVFHKGYWKNSLQFAKSVKSLCMCSVLFTLMMLCKFIKIPSGFGSLGLGLTYLVFATICLIYGPVCGLFIGFCSDTFGYFLTQGGQVFFLGYTLDAMLSGFIYGLFFYKKKITFTSCLMARFFVNIGINVGLGGFWWKIIYQLDWNGYVTYLTLTSIPKNVLYLLPQSILLFIVFKLLSKPLASFQLIDEKIAQNITLF